MPKGRIIRAGQVKSTRIGTDEVTVVDECGGAMPDFETRAREWLADWTRPNETIAGQAESLAALLRAERERTLADVRKVVENVRTMHWYEVSGVEAARDACASILARLKAL